MSIQKQGPPEQPAETEAVTIIRYPNRRLYDRSQGKYVTLQDVEDTIRRGETVVVRDSKTGEDLTRSVLTQILLERYPERIDLLPVTLLHLMLRANEMLFGVIRESLRQSLLSVELLQRTPPCNPLGLPQDWLRSILPGARPPSEGPAPQSGEAEVATFLRRIGELERRLDERDASSRKRKPRK
jgi:polyhydroxyalkanoate synthesis repressor PhaR